MTDPYPNLLVEHIGDVTIVTLKPDDFFDQQMIATAKRELLDMVKAGATRQADPQLQEHPAILQRLHSESW